MHVTLSQGFSMSHGGFFSFLHRGCFHTYAGFSLQKMSCYFYDFGEILISHREKFQNPSLQLNIDGFNGVSIAHGIVPLHLFDDETYVYVQEKS